MPRVVLELVTLFHPGSYLPGVTVNTLPHQQRSRADMTRKLQRLKQEGKVELTYRYQDGVVLLDDGKQIRRFRNAVLLGVVKR
jgi:hypothetical protein